MVFSLQSPGIPAISACRHVHFASPLETELKVSDLGITTRSRGTAKPTNAAPSRPPVKTSARAADSRVSTPGRRHAGATAVKQMQTARQRSEMQKLAAAALVRMHPRIVAVAGAPPVGCYPRLDFSCAAAQGATAGLWTGVAQPPRPYRSKQVPHNAGQSPRSE